MYHSNMCWKPTGSPASWLCHVDLQHDSVLIVTIVSEGTVWHKGVVSLCFIAFEFDFEGQLYLSAW